MKKLLLLALLSQLAACNLLDENKNTAGPSVSNLTEDSADIRVAKFSPEGDIWLSVNDNSNPVISIFKQQNGEWQKQETDIATTHPVTEIAFVRGRSDLNDGALLTLTAADYGSSDLAFLSSDLSDLQSNLQPKAYSDIKYQLGNERVYQIGRFDLDYIASVSYDDLIATVSYQYSVNDDGLTGANPYTVIEKANNNAYLIRYGSTSIWQINPQASAEEDFKLAEIDLSDFADADGTPEMADAVLVGDVLYVILQRLEYYDAIHKGLLIAIDTTDNSIIDLDNTAEGTNGLELLVTNPENIQYVNNKLLINAVGRYAAWDGSRDAEYTGGVETINPQTLDQTLIFANNASTGQTSSCSVYGDKMLLNQYFSYGSNKVTLVENINI
ncbi:MAG: hypothetical protein H7A09_08390 [Oceanospirillaceae bacterium]|nr:hypothetical protein [Oceanospirillaceae bacterium]